jgi:hypothetical protein
LKSTPLPKESSVALILRAGFAAQVIAAFVIFVLGYVGLFAALMLVMLVARGLYESVKWVGGSALARLVGNHFTQANAAATTAANAVTFDRRTPLPITSPANRAQLTFHPALNRRRAAGNHSSNLSGGTP